VILPAWSQYFDSPLMLLHCWLGDRQNIWPIKILCRSTPNILVLMKEGMHLPGKWPAINDNVGNNDDVSDNSVMILHE